MGTDIWTAIGTEGTTEIELEQTELSWRCIRYRISGGPWMLATPSGVGGIASADPRAVASRVSWQVGGVWNGALEILAPGELPRSVLCTRVDAAIAECERLERASGAEQCQTELPFRVAARRIRAKLEGR